MARTPGSTALLDAWETALAERGPMRAPELLVSLGWVDTPDALAHATIGETDRLLFELHHRLFGPTLDCVVACPSCHDLLEFTTTAADIVPPQPAGVDHEATVLDGRLRCRRPTNADVVRLLDGGWVDSRGLLEACLLSDFAALGETSDEDCDRALGELAHADPGASVEIAIDCSCGNHWIDEFDIRGYLMAELTDWAARTLRDVHRLASRYGWSESAILGMSPWRTRIYLDACEAT